MSNLPTVWDRSPHTAVKHQILKAYLGAWFAKLAWTGKVVFVDGFAGPGRYSGGEEGSPLIALELAIEHRAFSEGARYADCERVLLFIEEDPDRYAHLEQELGAIELPPRVTVVPANQDFEGAITSILDEVQSGGGLAPSFVMIDPFGWTGFPYSLIERLGNEERSEVLVSFMYESINRFLSHPDQDENWQRLFGSDEWRELPTDASPQDRRDFLVDLYQRRLKEAGFEYQWKFELRDEGNRPEYYLVYGSQAIEGLAAMKEAMWKVAPDGSFTYSDYAQGSGQMSLFVGDPEPEVLAQMLIDEFRSAGEVSKDVLLRFTLTSTDFVQKHLNNSLRYLERNGRVALRRPEGRSKSYLQEVWMTITD